MRVIKNKYMRLFKRKVTAISVPVIWKTREDFETDQAIDYDKLGITPPKESERDHDIDNMIISLDSITTINSTYQGNCTLRTVDGSSYHIALSIEMMEVILTDCGWHINEYKK